MKLYFAGPLMTTAERDFNTAVVNILRGYGHEIFLPQEMEQRESTSKKIFDSDVRGIRWCEAIVANMDGPDPDSGTCFELGEAWRDKLSVVYRTDIREEKEPFGPYNLMLHQAANVVLNLQWKSVKEIADAIHNALERMLIAGTLPKGRQ